MTPRSAGPCLARLALTGLVLASVLLAGCTRDASERPQPVIREPDGSFPPIAYLEVTALLEGDPAQPIAGVGIQSAADAAGTALRYDIRVNHTRHIHETGMTDTSGMARLALPAGEVVYVVADHSKHMREVLGPLRMGAAGEVQAVTIPIYVTKRTVTMEVELQGPLEVSTRGALGGDAPVSWQAQELRFAADDRVSETYLDRLTSLQIDMVWTNTETTHADLGIVVSRDNETAQNFTDVEDQSLELGTHREMRHVDGFHLVGHGWRDDRALFIGPGTDSVAIIPSGLLVTMEVEAEFANVPDHALNPLVRESPGAPFIPVLLVALLVLHVGARQRVGSS